MSSRRALAALLPLCLWTAASRPATLVLVKSHAPTRVMLDRWCALAAELAVQPSYRLVFALQREHANETSVRPLFEAFAGPDLSSPFTRLDLVDVVVDEFFERHPFRRKHVAAVGYARILPVRWFLRVMLELAFFDLHRDRYVFDHLWVIEQDVAWSGSLLSIMRRMEGAEEDMLCTNVGRFDAAEGQSNGWWWPSAHSGWAQTAAGTPAHPYVRCFKPVQRLSHRLLSALIDRYILVGAWAHDEWFAATVCELQIGLAWTPPCLVGDMLPTGCIGSAFTCCNPLVNESQWAQYLANAGPRSLLFHRIKL